MSKYVNVADAAEKKRKQERTVTGMDCIDRKALRDALYDADAITMNGVKITNQFPAADVAPVRYGRWEKRGSKWQCTNCKVLMSIDGTPQENLLYYCPNCGAKMDLEESNEL